MATKSKTTINVDQFKSDLETSAKLNATLRNEWQEIERSASVARRAYFESAMGDDAFAKVATVLRRGAPAALKLLGAGSGGAALTSLLANTDATGGILGTLKSLLVLPL